MLAALVLVIGWLTMPRLEYPGDPQSVRAVTWSLLERGSLAVPAEYARQAGQPGQYFFFNSQTQRYYSKYGDLNAFVWLPALAAEKLLSGQLPIFASSPLRVMCLNVTCLVFSLALAGLLFTLAERFSQRRGLIIVWCLITLYGGFGWNYLRAQTGEIWQWIWATAYFICLVDLLRAPHRGRFYGKLALAQLCLAFLVFTKGVYWLAALALLPAVYWSLTTEKNPQELTFSEGEKASEPGFVGRKFLGLTLANWLALIVPLLLLLAAYLFNNYCKFADPFQSGYTQWQRESNFFSGCIFAGVWGFLFDPQKSILLYQPLLVPALVATWCWGRNFKRELILAWVLLGLFLLFNAQTINWGGHWSYGPRYLLAVLTPVTLPVLALFAWTTDHIKRWPGRLVGVVLAVGVGWSFFMQLQVNSLDFFTYYKVEAALRGFHALQTETELKRTPWGMINYHLNTYRSRDIYPGFLERACQEENTLEPDKLPEALRRITIRNYYWLP